MAKAGEVTIGLRPGTLLGFAAGPGSMTTNLMDTTTTHDNTP